MSEPPMFVSNYSLGSQICIPDIKQQESRMRYGAGGSAENLVGGGALHCVIKWILRGHLKRPPSATILIIFEVISIDFW